MKYLLDANVFIQAKNLHYGFDFCPAFWEWLVQSHDEGIVCSIDKVADEIAAGSDELSDWLTHTGGSLFIDTDSQVAAQFGSVSSWATTQGYTPAAISTFLQVADFYLLAHALAGGHVIVTHEVPANSNRRIKIPDACIALGVEFTTPFDMLRRERAMFVLGQ